MDRVFDFLFDIIRWAFYQVMFVGEKVYVHRPFILSPLINVYPGLLHSLPPGGGGEKGGRTE